jgi:hypothetical protein
MKTIKTKERNLKFKSWIFPSQPLSQDEFIEGIRDAEKGSFHSIQESQANFESWLKSREKK